MKGSDRPFARSVVKLLAPLIYGKRKAHWHSWLPWLSLGEADQVGQRELFYKGKRLTTLCPLEILKEQSAQAIHIIGSGPSVRHNDLTLLPERSALLLNGAISLIGDVIAQPLAIVIQDERFVWRHFPLMKEKIADTAICLFSVGVLRALCEIDPDWLLNKQIVLIDDIRKPYGMPRRSRQDLDRLAFVRRDETADAGFSLEPDRGVVEAGSVAVSALQFAVACNPAVIGLFGIDISNANEPRFYEEAGKAASSGISGAEERLLAHFRIARQICEERNIELRNFSSISALLKIGIPYDHAFEKIAPRFPAKP